MTDKQQFDLFVHYASLAFFASAWAERNQEEIDQLMEGLSHEEIVRRLRGTS